MFNISKSEIRELSKEFAGIVKLSFDALKRP